MNLDNLVDLLTKEELELLKTCDTPLKKRLFWQAECIHRFEFLVYILGHRDLGEFHKEQLKEIAKFKKLSDAPLRRLWLWSRGHFKSSLLTEDHVVDLIINNPNIRILIVSHTLSLAEKVFGEIRTQFMENEDFRFLFKEFCPKANKDGKVEWGTTEKFTIPNRTKIFKEPTLMCAGEGTNLTGMHYDVIVADDLVTRESVTNDTQIQASKDYYASLRQLFNKPTCPHEEIIGTIYHFNDLYASSDNGLLFNKEFELSLIPIKGSIKIDREARKINYIDGNINFPERFTEEGIQTIIDDPLIGPLQYASQYCLNPHNPKDVIFKEEWLKYYSGTELPQALAEYICVDPASTKKKTSDYTVIERWGVDWQGNHYLLEGIRDRLSSFERIDKLFQFVENARNLKWVTYEVIGGRHGDLEEIERKKKEKQRDFYVKETKSTTSSKQDRIEQRLVGQYHAGKIRLPYSLNYKSSYDGKLHDFVQELKLEFLQFPFTEHDDALDCQSQMFEETVIGGAKPLKEKENKPLTADDEEKYYQNIKRMKVLNPYLTNEMIKNKLMTKKFKTILQGA